MTFEEWSEQNVEKILDSIERGGAHAAWNWYRKCWQAALQEAARVAEKEGCTDSGCDGHGPDRWHSMRCPLGIAQKIKELAEGVGDGRLV